MSEQNINKRRTIRESVSGSITERKSKFIAYLIPVKNEQEALEFLQTIKKKHSDAKHNVYAYMLCDNNIVRYSDDGEPHGTAGLPVLEVLRKEGLTDITAVVTRYFGGILLGTGGLVRAYTAAVKTALKQAEIVVFEEFSVFSLELSYSDYTTIDSFFQNQPVLRDKNEFAENVMLEIAIPCEKIDNIKKSITELTGGRAKLSFLKKRYDFAKK